MGHFKDVLVSVILYNYCSHNNSKRPEVLAFIQQYEKHMGPHLHQTICLLIQKRCFFGGGGRGGGGNPFTPHFSEVYPQKRLDALIISNRV